ncbi:uncharacterized protein PV07_05803 [Cladophialophora immunda]|uniref:Choline monooxygenase, chloroplastic n=1 Tax=Cladophialophora immunda TaxID=569365 RepID=A0A0D2D2V1_9EURO|nr:uncharacterized protein PV07_05803 [Cladophialophora immunda]KIW30024.1 hypothetical protein PV07_05803 [Cladophialophora immunda]
MALLSSPAYDLHEDHSRRLAAKSISNELRSSLPAEFYRSPAIYQLERRAIFSKRWFLVSHKARNRNVGDYVQYEMAEYNFFLVKNKSGDIVGFHNVCRHRAFPLLQEQTGTARIFSCRYHGWSYSLDGALTKAPRFTPEAVPDFDPSAIHLFPVHVHVDRNGFIYVNLDARPVPELAWEEQYGDLDTQAALQNSGVDWDKVEFDFSWSKEGHFNWKVMQDNFNECYHCATAHPDVLASTALDTYYVEPSSNYIPHFYEPRRDKKPGTSSYDYKGASATHVFPGGHFSLSPGTGFMHMMRSVPISPTTTRMEYDIYKLHTPTATSEAAAGVLKFYQKVIDEDFELCTRVQRSLDRGIYETGPLHPFHEEGVFAFQRMVLTALKDHLRLEDELGKEVWAARPSGQTGGADGVQACEEMLGCAKGTLKAIEW